MDKYKLLSSLSSDFVRMAKKFGKIIIDEYFLPEDQQKYRTIPPQDEIGGQAGGPKCQCHFIRLI